MPQYTTLTDDRIREIWREEFDKWQADAEAKFEATRRENADSATSGGEA